MSFLATIIYLIQFSWEEKHNDRNLTIYNGTKVCKVWDIRHLLSVTWEIANEVRY